MRSTNFVFSLSAALAAAALAGCYTGGPNGFPGDGTSPTDDDGGAPPLDDAGKPIATGVPCEVETILSTYCWSCHGVSPTAPSRLVTYADLTAPAKSNANVSEAAEALSRMQASTSPMPPSGPKPTASDVATFSAWVNAQTPQGAKCGGSGSVPDDAGLLDAGQNPYSTPVQCTSNKKWTSGTGSTMRPGDACLRCHASSFDVAGTVYPTAHEPLNCNGINGTTSATKVVVTDAKNHTVSLAVNSVGNFYYGGTTILTAPFTVQVTSGSKTRAMSAKAPSGDCNSCHTQNGTQNAPGRIMAP